MASEDRTRLTKTAVVDQALKLADADGAEALTIRRLADQLGVTPMAIYWHFKNKEQLLSAVADHVMRQVRPDVEPTAPWDRQLRVMVEALLRVMRQHPSAPALLMAANKSGVEALNRATEAALELLSQAGFSLAEGFQIAALLLHDVIGLVEREPGRIPGMPPEQAAECHRQAWLALEALPADRYPLLVRLAAAMPDTPDVEGYYAFGLDLILAGVRALAAERSGSADSGLANSGSADSGLANSGSVNSVPAGSAPADSGSASSGSASSGPADAAPAQSAARISSGVGSSPVTM